MNNRKKRWYYAIHMTHYSAGVNYSIWDQFSHHFCFDWCEFSRRAKLCHVGYQKIKFRIIRTLKTWSQFGAWSICSTWDLDKSYFMVKILFKLFHRSFVKILIVFWDICRPSNDFFVICQFINDYNHLKGNQE